MVDDRRRIALRGKQAETPRLVHCAPVDRLELGHPAPDVRAIRIEPPCLARRVEDAIGPRVGPCPGDPLPISDVVRDVAVDEVVREVRGPEDLRNALLKDPGPSSYFARLAKEAAKKWTFAPADEPDTREWLLRFEFTRGGVTAGAAPGS